MRKFICLLSLLFVAASTALAQTYATPDESKVLTAEQLRSLTTETLIVFGPVQYSQYGTWYDGATGTYATTSALTDANVFVWEPILDGENATGKGYIKKNSQGENNYLQPANITTFGTKSSAQVFYPVMPVVGGTGSQNFGHDNIVSDYDETKLVRFVCNSSEGTKWFNFNGKQYNSGTGIWTAYEVRDASNLQKQINVAIKHVYNNTEFATTTLLAVAGKNTVSPLTNRPGLTAEDLIFDVDENTTELVIEYAYDATALPFKVGNGNYYNLFIKRDPWKNVKYSAIDNQCKNTNDNNHNICIEDIAKFYFEGDNVSGFTVRNVGAGADKALGGAVVNNASMSLSSDNTDKFVLENNGGTFVLRNISDALGYVNDVNSTLGYWLDGRGATDAGSSIEFVELPAEAVTVTYNYYYKTKDKLYTTVQKVVSDKDFTAPKQLYLTNDSQIEEEGSTGDTKTISVICSQYDADLPFVPSESYDAARWYLMDVHGNEANYLVYADESGNIRVKDMGTDILYLEGKGLETEQWCFIGNIYDGFKIYSRTAGSEKSFYQSSDDDIEITLDVAGQGFRLCATNGDVSNSVALKIDGRRYYINHRGTKMQGWDNNDAGSSFRFYAVTKTITVADIVQGLLDEIDGRFPKQDAGADLDPIWPDEYISGGFADFNFLTDVQSAIDDNDETALVGYQTKLNSFISLSNQHGYPVSMLLQYPKYEYGTAYLPFNTVTPEGLTLYVCNGKEGDVLTLTTPVENNVRKNLAYVVQATEEVRGQKRQFIGYGNQKGDQENTSSWLKGTHDGCNAPVGSYVMQRQEGVLGFYKVDGTRTIKVPAGKCYLELGEASAVKRLVFPDGTTTGIDAILEDTQSEEAPVYDLSGRRVKKATKGIYIIGGKKVVVK